MTTDADDLSVYLVRVFRAIAPLDRESQLRVLRAAEILSDDPRQHEGSVERATDDN